MFSVVSLWATAQEIVHEHVIQHAFVENKGQWESPILFRAKFPGGNLWVQQSKFVFHLQDFSALTKVHGQPIDHVAEVAKQGVVHLNFIGSNRVEQVEKSHPTPNYYNYFIGNDSTRWKSGVYGYSEAVLKEFYDGIDLKLLEEKGGLKYEFHVQPEINPTCIQLAFDGQKNLRLDKNGNLIVATDLGNIVEQKPYAYQIIHGKIVAVACDFVISNATVSFRLGNYNKRVALVIDPVLVFSTFAGAVSDNFGMTATYGFDGTAYTGGMVYGNSYPTPDSNAYDISSNFTVPNNAVYGITDAFISKYSADGTSLLWTTFLGGGDANQGTETAQSMICDSLNNVYVFGSTSSVDFPIVNGYQTAHAGGSPNSNHFFNGVYFTNQGTDIYVAKVSANGQNLLGSTYFGGSKNDGVNTKISSGTYNSVAAYDSLTTNYGDQFRGEIMLDETGNCIVASCSRSNDFPVLNAFQSNYGGMQDGVVFKLNGNLSTLLWSSYYGGSNNDACYSVKTDGLGGIVFAGGTSSSNLIGTTNGWQPNYNGGKTDGFVVRIPSTGGSVLSATYVGTPNYDQAFFVEIDRNNHVFVLGQSAGGTFPVLNAAYVNPGSSQFILKLNTALSVNLKSTVFGNGSPAVSISPAAFLVDICGNCYISGWGANILQGTPLAGMPVSSDAFQGSPPNGFDFYLMVIERDFNGLLYGSYIGGNQANEHVDGGTSRFDKNGVVYQAVCGGCGGYSDFPTSPNAWSALNWSTNCNTAIFKFDFELIPKANFTTDQILGCAPFSVTLNNNSDDADAFLWDFGNGNTNSIDFNPTIVYTNPGVYTIKLLVTDSVCLITDTAQIDITVLAPINLVVSEDIALCTPSEVSLVASTGGGASEFIWSSTSDFSDTLNGNLSDSILVVTPDFSTVFYVQAGNGACSVVDSISVYFTSSSLELSGNDTICVGETSTITAVNTNPILSFTYQWSPDSIIVSSPTWNSVTIQPATTQYMSVLASASNGCVFSDSMLVYVGSIAGNNALASASEWTVPEGATVNLIGNPSGYTYSWLPAEMVANPSAQNTTAVVENTTVFTLLVSDGICTKQDTVQVKTVAFICGEPYIYVPNAFSPNGDQENDVLFVRGLLIEGMVFRVFNRWGELVFESFDRTIGWDGTFKGKLVEPDVYDYYLKALCIDGNESIIKGNVTVLR